MRSPVFSQLSRLFGNAQFLNAHGEGALLKLRESRREFLRDAVALSLSASPAMRTWADYAANVSRAQNQTDIVIIGAGIAGLTAAHELSRSGITSVIYEASGRVGGRMLTLDSFNADGMTCELGGELVDTNHTDLRGLCAEFAIPIDRFADEAQGLEPELFYLGGRYYLERDLWPPLKQFAARFTRDQQKLTADELNRMSLEDYLSRLHDVDAWLIKLLRVAYVTEFGLESDEQSAALMFSTFKNPPDRGPLLLGDSDESGRIHGGNGTLIRALNARLTEAGVGIHVGHRLARIREHATGLELIFHKGYSTVSVRARHVICTLPFTALRHVEGIYKLDLYPAKKAAIREMAYGTNAKMMIGTSRRIWNTNALASTGTALTDLAPQSTWDSARRQPGASGILTNFLGGRGGAHLSVENLLEIKQAGDVLFPGFTAATDGHVATLNWTRYRWAQGSYASLRAGQSPEIFTAARTPELNGRLLFAGEHTDDRFTGFMNGACRSGKMAAQALRKVNVIR